MSSFSSTSRWVLASVPLLAVPLSIPFLPISQPDRFPPHPTTSTDGFYTRTQTPYGSLVMIICHVRSAPERAGMMHLSWTPFPDGPASSKAWRIDKFASEGLKTSVDKSEGRGRWTGFNLVCPRAGSFQVGGENGRTKHIMELSSADRGGAELEHGRRERLVLETEQPRRWAIGGKNASDPTAGPEGWIGWLGSLLPIHWVVSSTGSKARWWIETLDDQGEVISKVGTGVESDRQNGWEGEGIAHMEKNHGDSFPPSWIWVQNSTPLDDPSPFTFTLAGGHLPPMFPSISTQALPAEAYLAGLRVPSQGIEWDFKPPTTLRLFGWGPLNTIHRDAKQGTVKIDLINGWGTRRTVVESKADTKTFIPLSCPMPGGHTLPEEGYALESFCAQSTVKAFVRSGPWADWREVWRGEIKDGGLEFGGAWMNDLDGWKMGHGKREGEKKTA
ncbi:hypothetical protein [Phaffia rhodozyma]|uniref:Uncharacterized protein n=1 Tax=Phaffia rhodozyma TaxID=264483 RepID=A0A0F7SUT6_PHARH|nr:hypothetical protein [Phaffia rhodozyma]